MSLFIESVDPTDKLGRWWDAVIVVDPIVWPFFTCLTLANCHANNKWEKPEASVINRKPNRWVCCISSYNTSRFCWLFFIAPLGLLQKWNSKKGHNIHKVSQIQQKEIPAIFIQKFVLFLVYYHQQTSHCFCLLLRTNARYEWQCSIVHDELNKYTEININRISYVCRKLF